MLHVDEEGFDNMDRRLLLAVMEKFDGGPVGVDSLAAAIGEERGRVSPKQQGRHDRRRGGKESIAPVSIAQQQDNRRAEGE